MNDNSLFKSGKIALVTTIVAIALNPISVFVGYYLSKTLSAPKLTVEYVRLEPVLRPVELNKVILSKVQRNLILKKLLQNELFPNCKNWITSGKIYSDCLQNGLSSTNLLLGNIELEKETHTINLDTVSNWKPGESELLLRPTIIDDYTRIYSIAHRNKEHAIDIIKGTLSLITKQGEYIELLGTELQRLINSNDDLRTGEAHIVVGVLNSGDSDGALLNNSKLIINDLKLKLKFFSNDSYPVFRPHSFESLWLEVDESSTTKGAMDNFRSLLLKHNTNKFSIVLQTTTGELIANGRLPH